MSENSIYNHLIYYQYNKYVYHLSLAYTFMTTFFISLTIYKSIWEKQIKDFAIIGEGPLCNYLLRLLNEKQITYSHLSLPRKSNLNIDNITKKNQNIINFPLCSEQELNYLAELLNTNEEEIIKCQEKISINQLLYNNCGYCNIEPIYQYILTNDEKQPIRSYIKSIEKINNLNFIKLSNENNIISKYIIFIDINDLNIAEKYLDLDNPIKIRLSKKIERQESENNLCIELEDEIILCDNKEAHFFKDVDVFFDSNTGRYIYQNIEFYNPERLFFRCRQETQHMIIDPCLFPSRSPERDTLITIEFICKTFH